MARSATPWFRSDKQTWYVRVNGKPVSLGVKGKASKADALKAWHRLTSTPNAQCPTLSVGEVIERFLSDSENRVQPITLAFYRRFLEPFARKHGNLPAERLTTTLAESWAKRPTWAPSTRHDALGTLATAFRWACDRARIIPSNPLRGLRLPPKESKGSEAVIAPESFTQALEHVRDNDFREYLRFLWATGCRPMEASTMTFSMVDTSSSCVLFKAHKTASKGKSRIVYLTDDATTIVNAQRERHGGNGNVFRNAKGEPFDRMDIVKRLWRLKRKTGIKITAYGFRHSYATRALASGIPDAHVAALLGHTSTTMLHKHYSHLTQRADVLRAAATLVR